jgi:hypothetical protein
MSTAIDRAKKAGISAERGVPVAILGLWSGRDLQNMDESSPRPESGGSRRPKTGAGAVSKLGGGRNLKIILENSKRFDILSGWLC